MILYNHHNHGETDIERVGNRPKVTSKVKDEIRFKSESFHFISHYSPVRLQHILLDLVMSTFKANFHHQLVRKSSEKHHRIQLSNLIVGV